MNAAAARAEPFPWTQAMEAGFGLLRLSPAHFWSMTPRELVAALGAGRHTGTGAPQRADIERMMLLYPDGKDG